MHACVQQVASGIVDGTALTVEDFLLPVRCSADFLRVRLLLGCARVQLRAPNGSPAGHEARPTRHAPRVRGREGEPRGCRGAERGYRGTAAAGTAVSCACHGCWRQRVPCRWLQARSGRRRRRRRCRVRVQAGQTRWVDVLRCGSGLLPRVGVCLAVRASVDASTCRSFLLRLVVQQTN